MATRILFGNARKRTDCTRQSVGPSQKIWHVAFSFSPRFRFVEMTRNPNCTADARAAFQELGELLAVIEGEGVIPARGLKKERLSSEHEAMKRALEQAKARVTHAARDLEYRIRP
jgi:hypothetical protein